MLNVIGEDPTAGWPTSFGGGGGDDRERVGRPRPAATHFLFSGCMEAHFRHMRCRRGHELADRVEDNLELSVIPGFQSIEATGEFLVRSEQ